MTTPTIDLAARAAERRPKASKESPGAAPPAEAGPRGRKSAGDRWATLNEFVDVIAPHLSGAEVKVWLFMYRHARGGVVELSERQLATAAGVNKETAGIAVRRIVAVGLVWEIFKSLAAGSRSKYGIRPNPASRLAAVESARKPDRRACNRVSGERKAPGGKSGR